MSTVGPCSASGVLNAHIAAAANNAPANNAPANNASANNAPNATSAAGARKTPSLRMYKLARFLGADASRWGSSVLREVAHLATGNPHATVRVRDMCNPVGNLTIDANTTMIRLREIITQLKSGAAELLLPDETQALVRVEPSDRTTIADAIARLHKGGAFEALDVKVVNGTPHEYVLTSITAEYHRGDIDCTKCGRRGPSRYTGHRSCKNCRLCMFCSEINPFCAPARQVDDDEEEYVEPTPEEEKQEDMAFELAGAQYEAFIKTQAGDALLEEFYTWQTGFMKPSSK